MTAVPPNQPQQIQVRYPEDRASGDYANGIAVGINPHEVVIDYLVNVDGPGTGPMLELVRRIRLPIAMADVLLGGIGGAMDAYEQQYGPIHKPGQPE